jgi:hypothetical protein
MNNQHARLSQVLAEQRTTERHVQAARLSTACPLARPARRRRAWVACRWWQLARRPGVPADQPVSRPQVSS